MFNRPATCLWGHAVVAFKYNTCYCSTRSFVHFGQAVIYSNTTPVTVQPESEYLAIVGSRIQIQYLLLFNKITKCPYGYVMRIQIQYLLLFNSVLLPRYCRAMVIQIQYLLLFNAVYCPPGTAPRHSNTILVTVQLG